ncbi:hypothetical protein ROHU_012463 [Labeo rohita]|uniref:Uncharacterized protein n=1 Tax=Labeo rohita TaxID=84645 RepID=A0A498LL85_LABRO|nr:hypothetical protein ROHU_012427 [Labeo rohita]RXN06185.1 hypothetical protein ROHU_012463 [Labeo rohita]
MDSMENSQAGIFARLTTSRCFGERGGSRDLSYLKSVIRELFARIQRDRVIVHTAKLPAEVRSNQRDTSGLLCLYTITPAPRGLSKKARATSGSASEDRSRP